MEIFDGIAESYSNAQCALGRKLALLAEDVAERAALCPFHDEVDTTALVIIDELHDGGMVEFVADLLFALESLVEEGVGFDGEVGNPDGYGLAGAEVGTAVDGGGGAGSDKPLNSVVVELGAFHQPEDKAEVLKKS